MESQKEHPCADCLDSGFLNSSWSAEKTCPIPFVRGHPLAHLGMASDALSLVVVIENLSTLNPRNHKRHLGWQLVVEMLELDSVTAVTNSLTVQEFLGSQLTQDSLNAWILADLPRYQS